jgi:hypothetical protein
MRATERWIKYYNLKTSSPPHPFVIILQPSPNDLNNKIRLLQHFLKMLSTFCKRIGQTFFIKNESTIHSFEKELHQHFSGEQVGSKIY